MPSRNFLNSDADRRSTLFNEVVGKRIGFQKVLRFATLAEARQYRDALYSHRRHTKWPEGADPWAEVTIHLDKENNSVILERYPGQPKALPQPIEEYERYAEQS